MPYRNLSTLPVYRKALDLCHISREIAAYVSYNKDLLHLYKSKSHRDIIADSILTDAILIPQKIELAERSDSKHIRTSTIHHINIMTKNILSYCMGLEKDGLKEKEYINLLREEIKIFRKSYKIWKRSL
ncbi:hypothetical protein KO500_10645 [Cellulophaga baltica]|uniref:hypothetical protein n=1 Tax=Cellulophaga TaxID=104264 RepID=UPI001C0798F5|nr:MULTISPECIES: hypothetical protein [Cellulophaga]MBU2996897.1 hypothetical protein [Cellulophaga baltica]MDO6768295.1 hypothetical protein [Cellulophaga sp. 1_MG-2023]